MFTPSRSRACLWTFPRFLPVAIALASTGVSAQTVKLNGPLARPIGGDIQSFQIDRTGKRVVYLADQEQDDVFELFSVRPGSQPIRLNPTLPAGADVDSYQLSADGLRVVYRAKLEGPMELFSVPSKGGPSIRLNAPLAPNGFVSSGFLLDATSRYVAFIADWHLFVAPIDGSAPAVQLDTSTRSDLIRFAGARIFYNVGQPGGGTSVFSANADGSGTPAQLTPLLSSRFLFDVTADGSRALYLDVTQHGELFSVPGDGGVPVQLSVPGRLRGDVSAFRVSPDGRRAVYERVELFSVPVAGGEAPIALGASSHEFQIDPESAHVVFQRPVRSTPALFTVPILGGADPVQIAGPARIEQWQPASGGRVVYLQDVSVPGDIEKEIHSARVDGAGTPLLLAHATWTTFLLNSKVAGTDVLYRSMPNSTTTELYTVPLDGSRAARRIDRALVAERSVQASFQPSGDGSRVAYLADRDADEVYELFLAPTDASRPAMKLNPPLPIGRVEGDVGLARFSPDGSRAFFIADAREDEVFELFSVSSAGDEAPVRLNEPLVPGGDVKQFEFATDRVVYLADQDVNDVNHVYSLPIGGGTPVRLDGASGSVLFFQLTSDGSRVVFRKDENGDHFQEISVVPVDGSSPPVRLEVNASSDHNAQQISPASDRLVYIGDPDRDGEGDLFSVPLAGGAPVRLSDPTPAGRIVLGFAITADSQRVISLLRVGYYVQSLFSVPIDGSSSPIRLDAALSAQPTVRNFALSPDGSRVVFSSDAVVEGLYELYSMASDGSTGPVQLHTSNAELMEVTPDGTRVVYLVAAAPGSYELHVAPLDASSPPLVLSPALRFQALGDGPIRITPDATRVVFRAAPTAGGFRLHVVPIDGSSPPIRLTDPDASVMFDFRMTSDGRTLVYRSGVEYGIAGELFQVSVDGPRLPVRLGRGSSFGGTELSPDGTHVLHHTTQDQPGVIELYSSRLVDGPRATPR